MKEKILEVCLEDDNTIKTVKEVYEPRYTGECVYSQDECESIIENIKDENKIWTRKCRAGFELLCTEQSWEPSNTFVEKDIDLFQKYLDKKYGVGKYEAFALGAYIHTNVSFALNKSEDNRCRFDSGTCGFIGVPKEKVADKNKLANLMSDAWNGNICEYQVYDNYDDDYVEGCWSYEEDLDEWLKQSSTEYGIDWDNVEPQY